MDTLRIRSRRRRATALLSTTAGCLLAGSLAFPGAALAQVAAQEPVREELEALDAMDLAPSSLEQGQTRLRATVP